MSKYTVLVLAMPLCNVYPVFVLTCQMDSHDAKR